MKSYFAEFIGTFFIVLFGCGSMALTQLRTEALSPAMVPAIFGIAVAAILLSCLFKQVSSLGVTSSQMKSEQLVRPWWQGTMASFGFI